MEYTEQRSLWDRFWKDKRGEVIIYQRPNFWLITWAVVSVVSIFAPHGKPADVLWYIGTGFLSVWALLEIFKGVNYFRRLLGVIVLIMIIASFFNVGR
jgi:hypothetical protein